MEEFNFQSFLQQILSGNEADQNNPNRSTKVISYASRLENPVEEGINAGSARAIAEAGYDFPVNFYGIVKALPKGHYNQFPNCIDPRYKNYLSALDNGIRDWYILRPEEA